MAITIDKIKKHIKSNNLNCEYISGDYKNNSTRLKFKCHCGNLFEISWAQLQRGKFCCNECSRKREAISRLKDKSELIEKIKSDGFTIISDFNTIHQGCDVVSNDGYMYHIGNNYFNKNSMPEAFNKHNKFAIDNIKNYIKINNINCNLLSTDYHGNTDKLHWKCECGTEFVTSWASFLHGQHSCIKCSRRESLIDRNYIIETASSLGYEFISDISRASVSDVVHFKDAEGYKYSQILNNLLNGKRAEKFHNSNVFTIDNINKYLQSIFYGEYKCIDDHYDGNTNLLLFKHIPCGTIFEATLQDIQGKSTRSKTHIYRKQCPTCKHFRKESFHASVLKQVFMREIPDTVCEDRSCTNPNSNRVMPTDIVNHRLKIAIEVQSSIHDKQNQKTKDDIKRNFWINKGYKFYNPDIRDHSVLGLIQLFFPYISEIPDYIDFNYSDCMDYLKIQKMLNDGLSTNQIASDLCLNIGSIRSAIGRRQLLLPENYKEKILNWKPIVCLSPNGEYINRYGTLAEADRNGFASGTVCRVLYKKQDFSYGLYWLYEEDYLSGKYSIPKIKDDKFALPVDKYTIDNTLVKRYNSIYEAEKDSKSSKSEIYRVAKGDRKSSKNEKWKFHEITA